MINSVVKQTIKRPWTYLVIAIALMLVPQRIPMANACTVMRLQFNGHLLVARNHDWPFGEGLLVVNQRGIEKTGISPVRPAKWISKYGSVSFVQFGREIPFAGMNEQGLTVDLLQLHEAVFPVPNELRTVNVVQWVQFQLDTAKDVGEVIASLRDVCPMPMLPAVERVHYFVTDASGDAAVIEFLDGDVVIQHGTETVQCALANSTWDQSCRSLAGNQGLSNSDYRYSQAVQAIRQLDSTKSLPEQIEYAFGTLDVVSQQELTQWSIVYDPIEHRIWLETSRASERRWIDLDDLSFDPHATTLIVDVNSDHKGDLKPHLEPYSDQANRRLVQFAFGRLMPAGLARIAIEQLVLSYPSTLRVAAETPAPAVGE